MKLREHERDALRRIYEAAQRLSGSARDAGVTEVTVYLSEGPSPGAPAVQVGDPYETAKVLALAGWVRIESHDDVAVRLTEAGARAAGKT